MVFSLFLLTLSHLYAIAYGWKRGLRAMINYAAKDNQRLGMFLEAVNGLRHFDTVTRKEADNGQTRH